MLEGHPSTLEDLRGEKSEDGLTTADVITTLDDNDDKAATKKEQEGLMHLVACRL